MSAPEKPAPWRPEASFGEVIRVVRCGWGWSAVHGCYVRFSDAPGGRYRVEVCPPALLTGDSVRHRAWWEGPAERRAAFLESCVPLRTVRAPTQPMTWTVGEDGQVVG